MDEMMGQENEAQAGTAGVKLTRTHRLKVEHVARGSKERLTSGALVVELEGALHSELVGRLV
jgi:hypothetical protein